MKGDFSKWGLKPADNFSGVLHQQGRVLLDQDWNASTQIQAHWRELAGRDVIGGGLVAVPVAAPDGLKILSASATVANGVEVVLQPGRAWVDGINLYYDSKLPLQPLHADYLQAPAGPIAAGQRDAVILEVWDDAFNAFQDPRDLLEPALGGPDTTERVKTSMAVKLLRLNADQGCGNLPLDDGPKGKLTVTPSPTVVVAGSCPVPDSGGYTGAEHFLYRIEIATPSVTNEARFKWSQFNGGLVGRGEFTIGGAPGTGTVAIRANNQMINQCGLDSFYLEALAFDPAYGHWRIVFTANASLVNADTLSLTATTGAWPAPAGTTGFFRLWNGIALVKDHPTGLATPNPFHDGIRLELEPPLAGNSNYKPGDYWTFPVRASGVVFDPSVWPASSLPQGIEYHRAALGILEWTGPAPVNLTPPAIHDCRQPFLPLARIKSCCTFTVGDNKQSFGQFTSIQAAVDALPAQGGTVCVLAGIYSESIVIDKRVSIRIHGCGPRTRISAVIDGNKEPAPAFLVRNSDGVVLEDMAIESGPRSAVQIDNSRRVTVRRCLVQMRDISTIWQAIYSRGDDILIEENIIEVLPREGGPKQPVIPPEAGSPGSPASVNTAPDDIVIGFATRGGIQLAGGSDRVQILDNIIQGGIWNGITLGSLVAVDAEVDQDLPDRPGTADPCDPCKPVDLTDEDPEGGPPKFVSAGDLYDIRIERNRITDMGINGIGVVRFFNILNRGDLVGVHNLHIYDNLITRCVRRDLLKVTQAMEWLVGYGGIALARVSDLRILRNEIVANGPTHRVPICGVYAIFVQGLQLDDNRIIDNGGRTKEPAESTQSGIRGGVHIWIVTPVIEVAAAPSTSFAAEKSAALAATNNRRISWGSTTATVRDNIIVSPLGRALTFFALGPVVVARNRLVTQATTGKGLDVIATTVLHGNLGISNEWTLGLLLLWILKLGGKLPVNDNSPDLCTLSKTFGAINLFVQPPTLWPPLSRNWFTGKTLFTENQVSLDVTNEPLAFAFSSIALFSLDDIGFTDNQLELSSTNFFLIANAIIGAGSVRVADNRFAETWMRAFFSGFFVGAMNTTTDNQSTHCLKAFAPQPNMLVLKDNISLSEFFCPGACGDRRVAEVEPNENVTSVTGGKQ